jgi:vitamin B12 transporter
VNAPLGERWNVLANWTYNDTEDAAGQPRPRRPENFGNLGVQYRAANDRLSVLANYRLSSDAVDVTFAGTVPLPDYEVLDLSVSFDATDQLQIYGRVQNVTDEAYYEVAGFNTAGQAIYGGVRLRF